MSNLIIDKPNSILIDGSSYVPGSWYTSGIATLEFHVYKAIDSAFSGYYHNTLANAGDVVDGIIRKNVFVSMYKIPNKTLNGKTKYIFNTDIMNIRCKFDEYSDARTCNAIFSIIGLYSLTLNGKIYIVQDEIGDNSTLLTSPDSSKIYIGGLCTYHYFQYALYDEYANSVSFGVNYYLPAQVSYMSTHTKTYTKKNKNTEEKSLIILENGGGDGVYWNKVSDKKGGFTTISFQNLILWN